MELSRRHRVTGVPKTIINDGKKEILGALPEDAFVQAVVADDSAPTNRN
jgi:hypothetical protein